MKIYVVTRGEYSDYHICAVTDDKEKARIIVEKCSDHFNLAKIEEYDTEDCEIIIKRKNMYSCSKYKNNEIEIFKITRLEECDDEDVIEDYYGELHVYIFADNEEQALKIASDKFAKYISEKQGL